MRVVVSGASGLIGSALVRHLRSQGDRVDRLVRGRAPLGENEIAWDPRAGTIDIAHLEGADAVVNLSGATIAKWPWTRAHERRVLESRVRSTALLAQAIAGLDPGPRVFVSTSAIGYYGSRGDELLVETSSPGAGFLSEVCVAWESAAEAASRAGIRLVTPRFGLVLSGSGGALLALLRPFRLGLGGRIGDGRQFMSWIALDDLVRVVAFAIAREDLKGPVNAVAPEPARNEEFTRTLGRVLRRPTLLPSPAFAARLILGKMADEMLLSSARVEPSRLKAAGFSYLLPTLEGALRAALSQR